MSNLELKSDEALFEIQLDMSNHGFHDDFADRYRREVSKTLDELSAGGLNYSYTYTLSEMEEDECKESAKVRAAHGLTSKVFRRVNVWLERDYLTNRPYIGIYAKIVSPLFSLDDGSNFHMDYFQEVEENPIWLEGYMEDLEFSVQRVYNMVQRMRANRKRLPAAALLALLTLLLLAALKNQTIWDKVPILQLILAPLLITAGGGALVLLIIWLFGCFADRKSERQKVCDAFMEQAEKRIPFIHRILRFYTLWGQAQNRELPPKLARITRYTASVVELHDEIAGGHLPTDRPKKA